MAHPYFIYIWRPPLSANNEERWHQPLQCATQQWALYIANLIHQDSRSVIKVECDGLRILCLPDAHAVEQVEKQLAQQQQKQLEKDNT
jgi:hypothetical protein